MAPYDTIAKRNADDERIAFARRLVELADDVIAFVDKSLGWDGSAKYDGLLGGSFNISLKLKHCGSDERVIIRFPYPGKVHASWREEKVENEVAAMRYIRDHTSIPVPCIRCWGLADDSPHKLGPFIVMDWMEGRNLGRFLARPTEDATKPIYLNESLDEAILDDIYEQIAGFMLELSRLEFPRIGALSGRPSEEAIARRPLTYDMNEMATVGGYAAEHISKSAPFDRAGEYFAVCAGHFRAHLEAQRNIAGDDEDLAERQFVARLRFAELIPTYTVDDAGPFRLFCDDLRPTNMLVDPCTLRITAVLDFEFTNAMPAQFAHDVPWWLLLQPPAVWLREGKMHDFLRLFVPRKDQFLRAMERVEAASSPSLPPALQPPLSARMRNSWNSGRFWFNLASRCSFDIDDFYWQALYEEGLEGAMLDSVTLAEKESFVHRKMRQMDEFCKDKNRDERFADE